MPQIFSLYTEAQTAEAKILAVRITCKEGNAHFIYYMY